VLGQLVPFGYLIFLTGIQSDFQMMLTEFYSLIIPIIMMILFITQIAGSKNES
jgi:hypothetical protein